MTTKAHRIKLNPTPEQERYFYRASGVARFAWNWALSEYKRLKNAGEKVDWNEIKKSFRAKIDAEFPFVREVTNSKLCSCCGAKNDLLTISDREWDCLGCGAHHDRDFNASLNIELEGLRLLAGTVASSASTPVDVKALAYASA